MFALRPSHNETSTYEKKSDVPAKMRPKTYDEIRAKVLDAPQTIIPVKGKKK